MNDLDRRAADAYCRCLTAGHYENFIVASGLVPEPMRLDLARIYAFCRITDDLGDESGSPENALSRLERWRDEVRAMFAGTPPVHPVLAVLLQTIERTRIPAQTFLDLIEANVLDQRVSRYRTWPELDAYCRFSAAPVGRIVLAVFGITDPRAPALSDDVCIGLQLANHAQDVKRDAEIGRQYLLEEDVDRSGVDGAVRSLVERARAMLDSGRALEPMAPFALRLQLSLYRLGGQAICDAIERVGYHTDRVRPTVTRPAKASIVMRALASALRPNGVANRAEPA